MKRTEKDYLESVFKTFLFPLKEQVLIDISEFCKSGSLKEFAGCHHMHFNSFNALTILVVIKRKS
jgi:hypothetical protein